MSAPIAQSVLIIEDSLTTRQIVALTFRNAGFLPIDVGSAQEAMASMRKIAPDLVIVDRGLPDASGFSVCRFVRGDAAYARTKIILVSGHDEAKTDPDGFPGAYDAFLAKPFSLKDLLARARELVRVTVGWRLAYRPRPGSRIRVASDIVAMIDGAGFREHCVQEQEIVEVGADGLPLQANVLFPEWWQSRGGDRTPHALEGQQALLIASDGVTRPHGLRVKASSDWPTSLVPPWCSLLPGREVAVDEPVEGTLGKLRLKSVESGVATIHLDFDLRFPACRVVAQGPGLFDVESGHLLAGTFDGTVSLERVRGAGTLTVRTVAM